MASLFIGCAPAEQTRTYDVFVSNRLSEPVTVFLTKDGPPVENGWLSPEEMAAGPVNGGDAIDSGRVIAPHFTGGAARVTGRFAPQTAAVLRVYRRTGNLEDFAALSRGNDKRVDVPLNPGSNSFVVENGEGGMRVTRVEK